jgi:glycosyltransferase involved in cell wall biosynthesis
MLTSPHISILIPTYNDVCVDLVKSLHHQAVSLPDLSFEVLVGDDGSTDMATVSANRTLEALPHCRVLRRETNIGRAAIRNFLAREARGEWLLFADSHMSVVRDNYLSTYLSCLGDALLYGGYALPTEGPRGSLRYLYELSCIKGQEVDVRSRAPHARFHTCNFIVRREVMLAHPLDERFRRYGYEDVLFGKRLKEAGIPVCHIDNPLSFEVFEDNGHFVAKAEEGLRTLHQFSEELQGYSGLLDIVRKLGPLVPFIRLWHCINAAWERRLLTGRHPNLTIFSLYRLGYYLSLKNENKS